MALLAESSISLPLYIMYPSVADDPNYQNALPADFVWGYASASFQIEGGRESRGDCLWDEFLAGKDNGDLAADSYNQFEEDLKLLKAYGATAYRFSIAWNRIIPKGEQRVGGDTNFCRRGRRSRQ
jgi:beta-glucosidase/6-phospho-beta-glucosidase/beta-galactosidase